MKYRKLILYVVLTIVFVPLTYRSYIGIMTTANNKAFSAYAKRNLVAIQMLQRECKNAKGECCSSWDEMVEIWEARHGDEYNAVINEIKNKEWGGIYSYSIVKADERSFLVEARLVGEETHEQGADVWQISNEGKPVHVKTASFHNSHGRVSCIAPILLIIFIVLSIGEIKKMGRKKSSQA